MNTLLAHDKYVRFLVGRNIVPLELYAGAFTKIKHQCTKCGYIWPVTPKSLKNKTIGGCPSCYQQSVRKPLWQVEQEINKHNWTLVDPQQYKNSYKYLEFRHICGNVVNSKVDLISRNVRKCQHCYPSKKRQFWSKSVDCNSRSYASKIEMECCEFLISQFGLRDIILQKTYPGERRKCCDAYIQSIDTYVEISSINKSFYLDRIYSKRQLVKNFIFVSSIWQLQQILNVS